MYEYLVDVDGKQLHITVTPQPHSEPTDSEFGHSPSSEQESLSTSLNILLQVIQDEYSKEKERCDSLDNKAGLFISAGIAFIAFYIPCIPLQEISTLYKSVVIRDIVIATIALVFMCIAAIISVLSFGFLLSALKPRNYMNINIDSIIDEDMQQQKKDNILKGLLIHYHTIVQNNSSLNNLKATKLMNGLRLIISAFLTLTVCLITLLLII